MRSRERGARKFITEMQLATAHAHLGNREEAWRHAEAAGSLGRAENPLMQRMFDGNEMQALFTQLGIAA